MSETENGSTGSTNRVAHPDLIARVDRCGLSDREIEDRAKLPTAFLSKVRSGKGTTARADRSWGLLRSWLDHNFPEKGPPRFTVPPVEGQAVAASSLVEELVSRYREAKTPREYLEADRFLLELAARGEAGGVDRQVAQTVLEISKEARQKLKYARQEEARIDSRKPITVNVVWKSDWRQKVEENLRAEAAEEDDDDAD